MKVPGPKLKTEIPLRVIAASLLLPQQASPVRSYRSFPCATPGSLLGAVRDGARIGGLGRNQRYQPRCVTEPLAGTRYVLYSRF